jgi:two-component system, OmpR family, osmolarity sensor histidine kinase EnvZ
MSFPVGKGRPLIPVKRLLPSSIFGRSLLIVLTPIVILQIVVAVVFYERHWDTVTRRLTSAVAGDVSTLIWMMNTYDAEDEQSLVFRIGRIHLDLEAYYRPGERLPDVLPAVGSSGLEQELAHSLNERVGRRFIIDTEAGNRMILIRVELREGVLDVFVNEKRLVSSTTDIFVFWLVGTSLVVGLIAAYFLRQQIRPIRRLAAAADGFGKGRTDVDLKPSGAREVRQAANAFLMMRERILRQIGQRTQMLAGVSHDLRTPLTRMKLQIAMLGDHHGAAELKSDIADMERMVDGYLAFARGEGEESVAKTDLAAMIKDVAAGAHGGEVEVKLDGDLDVELRPDAFKRCLTNLVDNALRYARNVAIGARRVGKTVVITIDDDGPGIPAASREAAFRAFFRLDPSRNPETGGTGLGLTIARDIARSHGGDLTLDDSPMGGLRALLVVPV